MQERTRRVRLDPALRGRRLPQLQEPRRAALFLDVDGTLLDFAPAPGAVVVRSRVLRVLTELNWQLGGAVALVSGRSVGQLDRLFTPLLLPCAGLHGSERRDATGQVHRAFEGLERKLDPLRVILVRFAAAHPGILLEDKGSSLAIHFRACPELARPVDWLLAQTRAKRAPHFRIQRGALVREIVAARVNKGAAVEAFIAEPPFRGRRAIYIGDDITDLEGFAAVERHGGAAVAVGDRVRARSQLRDPDAVIAWLESLARAALDDAAHAARAARPRVFDAAAAPS